MDNILQIHDVRKSYASHLALDNVSLEVPRGSVYGLLGPNGAGKTTLIRIINHITAPDSGTVVLNGAPLTAQDIEHIGYLPEERGLYKKMKVGEQAVFFARLKGLSRRDAMKQLKEWFEKFDIMPWWGKKVEELSKGMAQKVQFIVTVLHKPQLLIFDEPFSGFDPINANLLKEEILKLRDQGATVIFSTHNMASVEEICDHITLINQSRNVLSGKVDELRSRYFDRCYTIQFTGDASQLLTSLPQITENHQLTANRLNVRLKPEATTRQLIAMANETIDLQEFAPRRSSMEDIFIQAVNETKQS